MNVAIDSSVWIDHLHRPDPRLAALLEADRGVVHPLVLLEVAAGSLKDRTQVLRQLQGVPELPACSRDEVLTLIESRGLHGQGLGAIDLHLLAACLASGALLYTRDRSLRDVGRSLRVVWPEPGT